MTSQGDILSSIIKANAPPPIDRSQVDMSRAPATIDRSQVDMSRAPKPYKLPIPVRLLDDPINNIKRNLNYVPSSQDSRDRIVKFNNTFNAVSSTSGSSTTPVVKVNKVVDLSNYCTIIKDQGSTGSCTAFATVAAMEFLEKKFNNNSSEDIFSERFTYWATRVDILKWAPTDSGAYVRNALQSAVKYGTCLENTFKYTGDFATKPSVVAYTEAKKYQALQYARFDEGTNKDNRAILIQNLKLGLDSGFPIIAGFICYSNIWNAINGVIPLQNGRVIGGHAILIVGYDDNKQLFKFKNSWGSSWGDKGYGYLPYNYYIAGDLTDIWSLYSQEDNDFKTIGGQIATPASIKQDMLRKLSTLLNDINTNLVTASDKTKYIAYFDTLLLNYADDKKIVSLITAMKTSFSLIAN